MANSNYIFAVNKADKVRLEILNEIVNPTSQNFISNSHLQAEMKVLDIACGNGTMSCWLAEYVGPKGSVTAIDLNPDNIELGKQLAKEKNINNIDFKIMSAYDLGELKEKFDCVHHRFLFVHLTNPIAALKAMYICLKKEGILLSEIAIHSHCYSDPPSESYDLFIKLIKQLFSAQGKDYDAGKTIYSLLNTVGFENIHGKLAQLLLETEHEKSILALGLQNSKSSFLQAGITDEASLDTLLEKLKLDEKKPGLWAMPSICQVSAYKRQETRD